MPSMSPVAWNPDVDARGTSRTDIHPRGRRRYCHHDGRWLGIDDTRRTAGKRQEREQARYHERIEREASETKA